MKDTSQSNRLILSILAVIVGLFMITIAPFLIQTSLERVISALQIVSAEKPAYASGIPLFSYAFPLYRGLIFIGGIALLLAGASHLPGEGVDLSRRITGRGLSLCGRDVHVHALCFLRGWFSHSDGNLDRGTDLLLVAHPAAQRGQVGEMGAVPGADLCGDADHACFHRRYRQPAHADDASRKTDVQRTGNVGACLVSTHPVDLRDPAFHRHLSTGRPQILRLVAGT